jgi:hypothetical protein
MPNKNMACIRKSDKIIHFATVLVTAGGLVLKPGSVISGENSLIVPCLSIATHSCH